MSFIPKVVMNKEKQSFLKTPPDDGLKTLNMYRDFNKTQNLI